MERRRREPNSAYGAIVETLYTPRGCVGSWVMMKKPMMLTSHRLIIIMTHPQHQTPQICKPGGLDYAYGGPNNACGHHDDDADDDDDDDDYDDDDDDDDDDIDDDGDKDDDCDDTMMLR